MNTPSGITVIDMQQARMLRQQHTAGISSVSHSVGQLVLESPIEEGLYFDNIDPDLREETAEFIELMLSRGSLTLLNQGNTISKVSVLEVVDATGFVASIFMREFVGVLAPDGETSKTNYDYTLNWLREKQIQVTRRDNEVFHERRNVRDEELENFNLKKIPIIIGDSEYSVAIIQGEDSKTCGMADIKDFSHPEDIMLHELIVCAFDDVQTFFHGTLEGYDIELRIGRDNDKRQSTTLIFTAEQMRELLYPTLLKLIGDDKNLPYDAAWRYYFDNRIIPKLSGIKM